MFIYVVNFYTGYLIHMKVPVPEAKLQERIVAFYFERCAFLF